MALAAPQQGVQVAPMTQPQQASVAAIPGLERLSGFGPAVLQQAVIQQQQQQQQSNEQQQQGPSKTDGNSHHKLICHKVLSSHTSLSCTAYY